MFYMVGFAFLGVCVICVCMYVCVLQLTMWHVYRVHMCVVDHVIILCGAHVCSGSCDHIVWCTCVVDHVIILCGAHVCSGSCDHIVWCTCV